MSGMYALWREQTIGMILLFLPPFLKNIKQKLLDVEVEIKKYTLLISAAPPPQQ